MWWLPQLQARKTRSYVSSISRNIPRAYERKQISSIKSMEVFDMHMKFSSYRIKEKRTQTKHQWNSMNYNYLKKFITEDESKKTN
jgi:hypothetical protein